MIFGMLSGLTLIKYSTMLWVYLGIRLFLCLGFIIGITWLGANWKRKIQTVDTQPQKSRFVSLGIGWSPRKEERRKGMTAERRQDKRTAWIATLTLIIGVILGYASRNYQLSSNRQTYTNVSILTKISDRDFWLMPERMQKQHIQICSESVVDWNAGDLLTDWTFEQKQGCKRVISYHEMPKGELDASIQVR